MFRSDNVGPCKEDNAFVSQVTGRLDYVGNGRDPKPVRPESQSGHAQLTSAIRHKERGAAYRMGGTWREAAGTHEGVREARITEEYDVINPATVAEAVRKGRPPAGYGAQPSLAVGEAMVRCRITYRVLEDGTILCEFDHRLLQPVRLTWYLGIMYQEKCDLYGGGVWRYIPKLRPFTDGGRPLRFLPPGQHRRRAAAAQLPAFPRTWTNPLSPPDRQLDLIAREDGTYAAAFAGGFLPCLDGAPEKRRERITDAGEIVASGKTYPTFAGGKENTRRAEAPRAPEAAPGRCFRALRGVAYRKYFRPAPGGGAAVYDIPQDRTTYVYMDFFSQTARRLDYVLLPGSRVSLLERGGDVTWRCGTDAIEAEGKKGYAVFRLEATGEA
jgi:hypothetical protein